MTPKSLSLIWRKFLPKNGYWSPLDWKKLAFASILSFSSFWLSQFCEIICKLFFKRVQCQKYRESLKMFWIQYFSNISYLCLLIWVLFLIECPKYKQSFLTICTNCKMVQNLNYWYLKNVKKQQIGEFCVCKIHQNSIFTSWICQNLNFEKEGLDWNHCTIILFGISSHCIKNWDCLDLGHCNIFTTLVLC